MRKSLFRNRPGYTLIEVATSVTVVAILTAAILPVVVKQIDDAEPTRLANDLGSMAKAIETFHLNVRPTYPGDMHQLTTPIVVSSSDPQITGEQYETKHTLAWKGPYISVNFATVSSTLTSGFGAQINSPLYWFNSVSGVAEAGRQAHANAPGSDYIAIRISSITVDEFNKLNDVIDGTGFNSSTGRVRYDGTAAYFLAVPFAN